MLDQELEGAVARAATLPEGDQSSSNDGATIRAALDLWMLRSVGHRSSVGAQITEWLAGALPPASGSTQSSAVTEDYNAKLGLLSRVYHLDFHAVVDDLTQEHHYSRLLPTPNPRSALEFGAGVAKDRFARLQANHGSVEALTNFADGQDGSGSGFFYFSMQLRGAILRAMLRAWFSGDDGFERLVGLAQTGEAELPHVVAPDRLATRRDLLGFVLTEAIDDDFYAQWLAVPDSPVDALTEHGDRLLQAVLTSIAPREKIVPENEESIARFVAGRTHYSVRLDGANRPIITTLAPATPVARNSDNTFRPGVSDYPFDVIIVPSFSALDASTPLHAIDPICLDRCQEAKRAFDARLAPFILVSGANIYPQGTRVADADLMGEALLGLGVSAAHIIYDIRARHSTTNLRNAGRIMLSRGLDGPALITTSGPIAVFGQDFYFGNPNISTFHLRCSGDLGYNPDDFMGNVGDWMRHMYLRYHSPVGHNRAFDDQYARFVRFQADITRIQDNPRYLVFSPSAEVQRRGVRDPLDP